MSELIKILLIEDELFDRKNFARSIKYSGLNATLETESNAEDGLKNLLENRYDIIFLDYKLPGEDGLELLKKIRQKRITDPVIIITSQEDEALAMAMVKAGADDYIPKSLVTVDGIVQIIRSTLRYRKLSAEKQKAQDDLEILEINLKTIIESSPIILFQIDKMGIFDLLEGEAGNFLGAQNQQVIGKSIFEVYKDNFSFIEIIKSALAGNKVKNTVQIDEFIFDIDCTPIVKSDKGVVGVHGIVKNATQRIRIIEQLIEAKLEAEKTAKVKDIFLANVSHEIRTPISAIMGFTDLLLDQKLIGDQYEYVNSIKLASENLLVIINDILDFSKIEAGKLTIKNASFDLMELMDSLKKVLKPQAKSKDLNLFFDIDEKVPGQIMGDSVRLHQILLNLIGNALKFTKQGSVGVTITCEKIEEDDVLLSFKIMDTGIGIPQDKLTEIFESFTQVNDDQTEEYGGTGLGLTIVKRLIELLNGDIQVESEVDKGTTFTFELVFGLVPDKKKKEEVELPSFADETLLVGKKVLLAEDNALIQVLAKKHLETWKMDVQVVPNGKLALESMENNDFDLILLDIRMPEMNGFETAKRIRSMAGPLSDIPIIAMTAHAFEKEKEKCFALGMNDYISKPFKPQTLKEKILNQVGGKRFDSRRPAEKRLKKLTQIPGEICNFAPLEEAAGNNIELMKELIEIYLKISKEAIRNMQLNYTQDDIAALKSNAHKFLNSVSTVGIPELTAYLNIILGKQSAQLTRAELASLIHRMEKLVNQSRVELKVKLDELNSAVY